MENEPRINFTGCLIDPLEDKAEIELRDTKTRKMNKNKENPLDETKAFIAGSLQEHSPFTAKEATPPFWFLSNLKERRMETKAKREEEYE